MRHVRSGWMLRSALALGALAVVAVTAAALASGAPPAQTARVSVDLQGHGAGTVSVTVDHTPPVMCPPSCLFTVPVGTDVTFHQTAAQGSYFSEWGSPCVGSNDCEVLVGGATRIAATFQNNPVVNVGVHGSGSGIVTISAPGGPWMCPPDCSPEVPQNAKVTLTAKAASNSTFIGFTEPCAGLPENCNFSVTRPLSVWATFRTSSGGG